MPLAKIVSTKPTVKFKDRKGYFLLEQDIDELYNNDDFYQLILHTWAWVEDAITDVYEREYMKPLGITKTKLLKLDEASFGRKLDLLRGLHLFYPNEAKQILAFKTDRDNVFHSLNGLLAIRDDIYRKKMASNSVKAAHKAFAFRKRYYAKRKIDLPSVALYKT